MFCLLAS
ncbi:unnamed protein product [Linum tenue]|nr:unnamed protein product [Linum tenue]CAI0380284.1 unnamed protein product [Linum tenue]